MATNIYRIVGHVVDRATGAGAPGLIVEAWDRDTRYHDMLGSTSTDQDGAFSFNFDSDYFGDFAPDRAPDVFFKVFRDGKLLRTTFDAPLMNLPPGETRVTVDIAGAAAAPAAGKDRVSTTQMLKAARFFRQSDFRGVWREQRDKGSSLGKFVAAIGGSALSNFDLEPVQPGGVQTNQVIGQDTTSARTNLAAQKVQVTEVKNYDPKADAHAVQAIADFPWRLKADDKVQLYVENGTVRYFSIVKPVQAATVDAQTVARIDKEMQDLKGEEIMRLRTELETVRQSASDKDAQIKALQSDLAAIQTEQRELATRFSADKLATLERQVKLLDERFTAVAPQQPPVLQPAPQPRPPVIRGTKPKRGKDR